MCRSWRRHTRLSLDKQSSWTTKTFDNWHDDDDDASAADCHWRLAMATLTAFFCHAHLNKTNSSTNTSSLHYARRKKTGKRSKSQLQPFVTHCQRRNKPATGYDVACWSKILRHQQRLNDLSQWNENLHLENSTDRHCRFCQCVISAMRHACLLPTH